MQFKLQIKGPTKEQRPMSFKQTDISGRSGSLDWDGMIKIDKLAATRIASSNLQLLFIFLVILLSKFLISLEFKSPWIFSDELVYAKMAENILSPAHGPPPLYPLLLSPAYFFSTDKSIIYHIMLLITSIINTSILFPSYFIMRKYCSETYSMVGSVAIVLLPCLVFYNFSLMCENLLSPLFIFSIWFLLEAYGTRKRIWFAAAILSVLFLFFTKHSGLSMAFGLTMSGIYYVFLELKSNKIHLQLKNKNFEKYAAISAAILSVASLLIYKIVVANTTISAYGKYELNLLVSYLNNLADIFFNINNIKLFSALFLHEIEYLMISSYFITSIVAIIILIYIFNITRNISLDILNYEKLDELKSDKAFKSTIIYFVFTAVALVAAVVIFMYQIIETLPEGYSYLYWCNRDDFYLVGRYIDPLVPAIFLFGLIGIDRIQGQNNENRINTISALIIMYLATSSLFALTFPFEIGKDIIPIGYLMVLANLVPSWTIVPILMLPFLVLFCLSLYNRQARYFLLVSLILFSAILSAGYLPHEIAASNKYNDQNQIGSYLEANSNKSSMIIWDSEDDTRDQIILPLTKFWAEGDYHAAEDPTGLFTGYSKNISYVISSRILPYQPVAYSTRGFILYKLEKIKDNKSLYDFDKNEGLHNIELHGLPTQGFYHLELLSGVPTNWIQANVIRAVFSPHILQSGVSTNWMQADAVLAVFSPDNRTANLGFRAQSFYRQRTLEIYKGDELEARVIVPRTGFVNVTVPIILERGANKVRMHVIEGCERPSDKEELKNPDSRCLSIAVQNITVD